MEYKIKNKLKSQKEIEVNLSADEVGKHLEKVAKKLSFEINIKGFRPGKAPINIIEGVVGEEKIWNEACYEIINISYLEIIKKEKIEVISSPAVEIIKNKLNESLVYNITVSVLPEVILSDYKKIAKEIFKNKKEVNVSDTEVEETINIIKNSKAKIIRVSREAKEGDEVILSWQGKVDGIIQESLKNEKISIIIGETKFIKGFTEEIIGSKERDKKSFILEVPFNEGAKKEVEFEVEILAVNEREIPTISDEFAKSLGDFSSLEDLKKKIKENIQKEKEEKETERIRIKMIEEISKDSSVEIPDILIEKETERMMHDFKHHFSERKESFEKYLKKSGKTEEQIMEEWKEQATKRILISLILQEIIKKEKIEVGEEELEKELTAYLSRIDSKNREKIDIGQLKVYSKEIIQNNKAFEILENS